MIRTSVMFSDIEFELVIHHVGEYISEVYAYMGDLELHMTTGLSEMMEYLNSYAARMAV